MNVKNLSNCIASNAFCLTGHCYGHLFCFVFVLSLIVINVSASFILKQLARQNDRCVCMRENVEFGIDWIDRKIRKPRRFSSSSLSSTAKWWMRVLICYIVVSVGDVNHFYPHYSVSSSYSNCYFVVSHMKIPFSSYSQWSKRGRNARTFHLCLLRWKTKTQKKRSTHLYYNYFL